MRQSIFASALALAAGLFVAAPAAAQDDVGSAVEAICCGANCCLIEGSCFTRGDTNPNNECEMCDPSSSQTSFTAVDGCSPPDAGSTPPPADAGSEPADGGGGCRVGASGSTAPLALLAMVAGLAFWRRRR